MPSIRSLRNKAGAWDRPLIVSLAVLALLLVRGTPPRVPDGPLLHSAVNCETQHHQRPFFDHESPQWITPVTSRLPVPRPRLALRLTHTSEPFFETALRDSHYNRPPPIS